MKISIQQETETDHQEVFNLVKDAFRTMPFADGDEQFLVEQLRKSDSFIPELSLVAKNESEIVGHILLTKLKIKNKKNTFETLSLAPVSVKPDYQKKGVGGQLILESHRIAKELGYKSIILVGHENYYPRFGYELCSKYDITLPFDAPDINCMVVELEEDGLKGISGSVEYPKEFFE